MADYFKHRTFSFARKDLLFDIDELSLKYAEASSGEDIIRTDAVSTDTDAPAEERVFTRFLDRRVAELRALMVRFLENNSVQESVNNTLDTTGDYKIKLRVTTEMQDSTLDAIEALCHDYIVEGALADWYSSVGVPIWETAALKGREDAVRLRELIFYKPMP